MGLEGQMEDIEARDMGSPTSQMLCCLWRAQTTKAYCVCVAGGEGVVGETPLHLAARPLPFLPQHLISLWKQSGYAPV